MKKSLNFLVVVLTCLFFCPLLIIAWDEIGSGGGTSSGGGGNCSAGNYACFCKWNNANFGAVKMTIIYYDGITRHKIGNDVAYAKGNNTTWIKSKIPGVIIANWLPYISILHNADYYSKLKEVLLNSTQESSDYPLIRQIFSDSNVDYDKLLSAAKTKGSYKDSVSGKIFDSIINQKIGSNGTPTKGIRIIVEPIFVVEETNLCPSYKNGIDRAMTVKNMLGFAYGKTDGGKNILNENTMVSFSKAMFIEKGDVGYYPVNANNLDLSKVSDPNSGWGINIYGPFDNIPSYCDPDKHYDGYSSGVAYCCITEKINIHNTTNNKLPPYGNMKRLLEQYELKTTKECNVESNICNPDKEGVAHCCSLENITPSTPLSVQLQLVNDHRLSRVMTSNELLDAGCGENGSCKYYIDLNAPKVCTEGNSTGKVIDVVDWDCIFASSKSNKENVKDHYYEGDAFKNSYCTVYCKEAVNYALPGSGTEVYSGRFLLVGNISSQFPSLSPITYKGEKTCRITSSMGNKNGVINIPKFQNDINKIDDEIRTYWDEWKIWQAKNTACTNKTVEYYNGNKYDCTEEPTPNYSTNIAAAKEKYTKALNNRNSYVSQINACSNYASGIKYKFNPEVSLSYDEPIYGYNKSKTQKKWNLKQINKTEDSNIIYYTGGNASNGTKGSQSSVINNTNIMVYSCSGNEPCTKTESINYPTTTWWEKVLKKDITYGLPDGTYQYISKATGESFDSKNDAGGENSIDMGMPNLPIHFSTLPGKYNFNLITLSFGDDHKFNKFLTKEGETIKFGDDTYKKSNSYTCSFKVKCDKHMITTDPEKYCEICKEEVNLCDCPGGNCKPNHIDINLIYRAISLYSKEKAFPGKNGNGRKPGSNWYSFDDSLVNAYIINNRNVQSYNVYKESPMYDITLNPNKLKEIRKYNKKQNSKILSIYNNTGIAGYADYESMKCIGNGTKCVSTVIRQWDVKGCGIKEKFDGSKYTKCPQNKEYGMWGLND